MKSFGTMAEALHSLNNQLWFERVTELQAPTIWAVRLDRSVVFEAVAGRQPFGERDIEVVASSLGRVTTGVAARVATLPALPDGRRPGDAFSELRAPLVRRAQGSTQTLLDRRRAAEALAYGSGLPQGVYKDANIRNVLVSCGAVVHLDFEHLTPAPSGYDLAKLVVSYAMTHGTVPPLEKVLDAYNATVEPTHPSYVCDLPAFAVWCELNALLTARYQGRHGYAWTWAEVRPGLFGRLVTSALG